ncbi:hypothetical protein GF325_15720 [Candidatus Bathyarchaeota archaeon]|nr:hypothetical protein [Candidatus Bathyarchaeota archaeon]
MARVVLEKEEMQHYQQLQSACGIAACLMILAPGVNESIGNFLDAVGQRVKSTFPSMSDWIDDTQSRHQVACALIILKAAQSKEIHDCLTEYDPENYEYIQEVITYELRKRMKGKVGRGKSLEKRLDSYLKNGKLDNVFLREYTTRIKTDVELKLLLACFGYRFTRFPYSPDGTGSINLEMIDHVIKSGLIQDDAMNNYDEILEFMLTFLKVNFSKGHVLINTGFHWVPAVKLQLEDRRFPELYYLDSTHQQGDLVKLMEWKSSKWFYLFQMDPKLKKAISSVVSSIMGID